MNVCLSATASVCSTLRVCMQECEPPPVPPVATTASHVHMHETVSTRREQQLPLTLATRPASGCHRLSHCRLSLFVSPGLHCSRHSIAANFVHGGHSEACASVMTHESPTWFKTLRVRIRVWNVFFHALCGWRQHDWQPVPLRHAWAVMPPNVQQFRIAPSIFEVSAPTIHALRRSMAPRPPNPTDSSFLSQFLQAQPGK